MKTTTFAVPPPSLLQLVSAHPLRRHAPQHQKKDGDVVATVVNTVYERATSGPRVIVYVDQEGWAYSTVTEQAAEPSPSPEVAPPAVIPAPVVVAAAVAPVSSPSSSSSPSSGEGSGFGFSYTPYNKDNTCKSQDQVRTDFAAIPSGYSRVRIYGTDCNQVSNVLSVAKSKGLTIFAGVYNIDNLSQEIGLITSAANGDWSTFDTISIGNELVNSGAASPEKVVAAVNSARSQLRSAGYTGPVVTVDTLVAARANPSLCDASDFCAVNCHPFFDGTIEAKESGAFLEREIPTLKSKLANQNQEIIITETGWPSKGDTNGAAVPSSENQVAAISSIKSSFSSNPGHIILFTTFNDLWKVSSPSQFSAEQYWGFLGDSPSG
ncbi:Glycoside hydrolase [Venustampulla echinocandica]|uniref:Glycoside hydrolase n=1 Tax=Venustampulla echinocandica TaxID=2656787 RepID=A0A370T9W3_9HELO|nr:Glycoside hydrolase [Venustampulla echinocandica]RDL30454.1 Glycoside hydrolase [Venustampulla echinocandica]